MVTLRCSTCRAAAGRESKEQAADDGLGLARKRRGGALAREGRRDAAGDSQASGAAMVES